MDLKKIKYIKNTGKLPEFANGMSPMDLFFSNGFPRKQLTSFVDPGNTFADKYAPATKKASFHTSFVDPGNTFANKYEPATKAATGEAMEKALKPSALSDVASKVGDVGAGLLGLASQYINGSRPVASADDFFKNARITQGNLGGYTYDILGDGGESQAMDLVRSNATANTLAMAGSGAATGAAVGGPIGAGVGFLVGGIGGLFSGNKAKKEQEKQIRLASINKNDKNVYGHDLAYTNMLRDQFSKEYGDQESQQLYENAANGKRPVWTPEGLAALKATAHVSNGEVVGNLTEGVATRIPGRKNNKDTKLASLADGDFVISNKYGLSDYAAATGDYIGALNLQEMLLGGMRNKHGYKNGKLPGLKDGFSLSATLPSIFNAAIGLDQISRSNDMLSAPSSYRSNPYEGLLGGLDDIMVNTLPIYNNNKNLEAKTRNAIIRSGGLSAGQIAAALLSGGYNTMLANANALMNAQLQNNQYRTNAITTKYNAGAKDAALRSATSQWDYDKYAAAHNAAMQLNQMGFYNIANAWREGYKNSWDREQFEKMYGLYFQDVKNKEMYYNLLRNGGMDNAPSASTFAPTLRQQYSTILNPYGMVSPLQVTSVLPTIEEINSLRHTPNTDMLHIDTKLATRPKPTVIKQKNTTVKPKRAVVTEVPMKKIDLTRPVDKEYKFLTAKQMIEDNRNSVLGKLSNVNVKKAKPRKDATTNAEALKNMIEYLMLGQKEYNKRYK